MNLKAEITVDELLKAMKLCACVPECSWCAYYDPKKLHKDKCYERRNRDFEYYISNLQDTNEALINGQETLQKALAERLAEVDDLKKHLATLDLCEKSNDELRSALKKKDEEVKAVKHYYNECLKDLKKAHAEIEILKKNPPSFILTDDESFASLTQKLPKLNPLVMSSDNASIVRIDADKIKAEAIKEFAKRLKDKMVGMCYAEDAYIPYPFTFVDNLVKEMVGDTE